MPGYVLFSGVVRGLLPLGADLRGAPKCLYVWYKYM